MNVKKIDVGKHQIKYVDEGQGEPLLFIHGWGVSPNIYQTAIYELGKEYRVIAPYFREGNIDNSIKKIDDLLNVLGIEKTILMAHSASGILAVQFAYHLPKKIRALVLVGTVGVGNPKRRHMFRNWLSHTKRMLIGDQKEEKAFMNRLTLDFLEQIFLYPVAFIKETKFILQSDVTDLFTALTMPILIIWAKEDNLVPISVGEAMVSMNKHANLKVIDGGHNWLKINPGPLLQYIKEFIK
jgi:pimeloyl-ACP methyl ester carboxylesterase